MLNICLRFLNDVLGPSRPGLRLAVAPVASHGVRRSGPDGQAPLSPRDI